MRTIKTRNFHINLIRNIPNGWLRKGWMKRKSLASLGDWYRMSGETDTKIDVVTGWAHCCISICFCCWYLIFLFNSVDWTFESLKNCEIERNNIEKIILFYFITFLTLFHKKSRDFTRLEATKILISFIRE